MKMSMSLLCLCICLVLFSCNSDSTLLTPPIDTEATLRFALPAGNPTDFQLRAEKAELVISATDIDPLTFPLTVTDSGIAGTITASIAGEARTFTITVYDSENRIQYQGSLSIDVDAGSMTSLPITVKKVFGGRVGDSLALVAIDKATEINLWDWQTAIHTWPGISCDTTDSARVTALSFDGEILLNHIPAEIGYLTELDSLNLRYGFINQLPDALALLQNLTFLDLSGNKLSKLDTTLCSLHSLKSLILQNNRISEIANSIDSLTNLQKLDLSGNKMKGTFSFSATPSALRILVLTNNSIDTLSESLCYLSSLQELYLEKNRLMTLPDSIGLMQELIILKASENSLNNIPELIWGCEKLQHLELQKNQLRTLPDSLGMLPSLLTLNLKENELISLGNGMDKFQKLQDLTLSYNQLQFGELMKVTLEEGFNYDPQDTIGTTVTLKNTNPFQIGISVSGSDNTYQWYRDDTVLDNATSDSLTVDRSGRYHCVISSKYFVSKNPVTDALNPMELIHRPIDVVINDTTPPVLKGAFLTVKGLSVNNSIDDTCFMFSDNITPKDAVTITLSTLPPGGYLTSNMEEEIASGYSFTLMDYSSEKRVFYTNEDSTTPDSLGFTLTDFEGNVSPEYFMNIGYF